MELAHLMKNILVEEVEGKILGGIIIIDFILLAKIM